MTSNNNDDENNTNTNECLSFKLSSKMNESNNSCFDLSQPFKCFHDLKLTSTLIDSFKSQQIYSQLFYFNTPYQARKLKTEDYFKIRTNLKKNTIRLHPFNKSTNNNNYNTTSQRLESDLTSPNIRNTSSNSILAHLKSISPNFKSIFVRPKTHKLIDASTLLDKPKLHRKHVLEQFYDLNGESVLFANVLPRIELKELRINSSVDELLKKFETQDDVIRRTIKSVSSSPEKSQINNVENTSNLLIEKSSTATLSGKQLQQQIPSSLTSTSSILKENMSKQIRDTTPSKSKWTCLICLSKLPIKSDVCSICGSSKSFNIQQSSTTTTSTTNTTASSSASSSPLSSPTTTLASSLLSIQRKQHPLSSTPSASPSSKLFSSYLINELGLKHKLTTAQTSNNNVQSSSVVSTPKEEETLESKKNPYIRKWTCIKCNCQNDSLKIVCMNCRWAKVLPTSLTKEKETDLTSQPPKKTSRLSTSLGINLEEETKELKDKNNNNVYCASCSSPIRKTSLSETETKTDQTQLKTTETLFDIFNKPIEIDKSNKWKCEACLVMNQDSNDKCVCCYTSKPVNLTTKKSTEPIKPLISTLKINKWTCDVCLVANDSDKTACVCCYSPKPGLSSSVTPSKPTLLTKQSTLILPQTPSSTSSSMIKFGSTDSQQSIKFGASTSTTSTTPSFGSIKFDTSFKLPTQDSNKSMIEDKKENKISSSFELPKTISFGDKPFKFGVNETSISQTIPTSNIQINQDQVAQTSSSNLFTPDMTDSTSTTQASSTLFGAKTESTTTKPLFGSSLFNIPSTANITPTNNLFSFSKPTATTTATSTLTGLTSSTTAINESTSLFNKPTEIISGSNLSLFNGPKITTLATTVPTLAQTQFTPLSANQQQLTSIFNETKPAFSFSTDSTSKLPTFSITPATTSTSFLGGSTQTTSQTFPQFDFTKSQPSVNTTTNEASLTTNSISFPSLMDQNKLTLSFITPALSNLTQQDQQDQQNKQFSFSPIIEFAKSPIIFSGNTEQGMNIPTEISQRRYRKAVRKPR